MPKNIARKSLNLNLIFIVLTTLCGCSVFEQNNLLGSAEPQQVELNYDELNQYVREWEIAKPKVERLSDLEHDLALIITEVGKLSTLKNNPPQFADQQITDFIQAEYDDFEDAAPSPKLAKLPLLPVDATNVESIRQFYAAHLALFLQEDSARVAWNILKKRYPKILEGLTPVVKKISRDQQTIYSLRVGPFDKQDGADLVCNVFSHYKYKCKTTTFSGAAI